MAGRFQETKGRWEIVPSPTINADKVIVPIDDSSSQNLETFLASIREYIDAQIERVANGCTVTLEGNGVTIRPSNVAYLKPALIEVEEDDYHLLSDISITMGGSDITSTTWDSANYVIIIPKVTNDINISVTTTILQLELDLDGVTLEYSAIRHLQEWTAEIVPDTGNKVQLSSVSILMSGEDITSTAYDHSTKIITIAEVTGNVSITAVGRPYDAEVEYLQSSGTQYINTGVKPKKTFTFDVKVTFLQANYNCVPFGCRSSGDTSTKGRQCFMNYNTNQYGDGQLHFFTTTITSSTNWNGGSALSLNVMYTYTGITCSSEMYDMTYPITLFAFNTIGSINASVGICRIGGWTAYNNGVKVMDLIPVRNNNVGYLYDKVSGQLFGNANSSGSFTYGNDVS